MIAALLLLLSAQAPVAALPASPSTAAAPAAFAPPIGRPMTYRVTARRLARDGTLASYTMVYALEWQRVGRGVQLAATLRRIESDARPELAGALAHMLQPLIGQTMTYLVAPDGSSIDLVDPEGLWNRVLADVRQQGSGAIQPEAKQMAGLLAALPAAERDRLATGDIRALIAGANPTLRAGSVGENGLQSVTRVEDAPVSGDAPPLRVDMKWTIDRATGLVMHERRQSWAAKPDGAERALIEERVRELSFAD